MEKIKKCLAVALNELGKINFKGMAVIPAGNAMSALYLAAQEVEKLNTQSRKEEQGDGENRQQHRESEKSELSGG